MRTDYIVIYVTCGAKKEAEGIARLLVSTRLVACANLIPKVESVFWWKGKVDRAKEVLVMLKARARDFKSIEKTVRRIHSYDVPEIIAIPIVAGSQDYLRWIENSARR